MYSPWEIAPQSAAAAPVLLLLLKTTSNGVAQQQQQHGGYLHLSGTLCVRRLVQTSAMGEILLAR